MGPRGFLLILWNAEICAENLKKGRHKQAVKKSLKVRLNGENKLRSIKTLNFLY